MCRRQLVVAAQLVDHPAALDVPDPADHVVGHAGHDGAVGSGRDGADPLAMGVDLADLRPRLDVPPDQATVVSARDQGRAGQCQAGHVAGMAAQLLGLGLGLIDVDLVNREVGAAAKELARAGLPGDGEDDVGAGELLEDLDFLGSGIGGLVHARTSRIGSVPGSVSGTGRAPTMYCFLMVDAECLVDGGEQLGGSDLAVDDGPAVGVGLAVDRAAADATAGERGAPGGGEVVAAQAGVDLRRAAELGERDHQRAFEQPALA